MSSLQYRNQEVWLCFCFSFSCGFHILTIIITMNNLLICDLLGSSPLCYFVICRKFSMGCRRKIMPSPPPPRKIHQTAFLYDMPILWTICFHITWKISCVSCLVPRRSLTIFYIYSKKRSFMMFNTINNVLWWWIGGNQIKCFSYTLYFCFFNVCKDSSFQSYLTSAWGQSSSVTCFYQRKQRVLQMWPGF